ncbi:SRPBCC family protein [Bosea sp. (in: a-proteobacteria)]|uniref:SRPBCC family protein n=1 Tax=Bosea sp. (in: a-proteobacteria) TaxID=1871050 RepID=UPI001DE1AB8E|nr:SRPBCC family protein [Bosea sp. (in: a-proteobacteria)]MBA4222177.1 polyketide cyclase [Methylobacterium sp.]MBR3192058.1 SRPBCC family protein [Bosea sp. (in: a-proteobacteria)]
MSERTAVHADFTIERRYGTSPARVFAAFADPVAKRRWSTCHDEGGLGEYTLDFREGGFETMRGAPGPDGIYAMRAIYHEIVPHERLVYSYEMFRNELRLSVSLATLEFRGEGAGTRLVFTEQAVFLDGHDNPQMREQGTGIGFDRLAEELARQATPS